MKSRFSKKMIKAKATLMRVSKNNQQKLLQITFCAMQCYAIKTLYDFMKHPKAPQTLVDGTSSWWLPRHCSKKRFLRRR